MSFIMLYPKIVVTLASKEQKSELITYAHPRDINHQMQNIMN